MKHPIGEQEKISPFFVFFLINGAQTGVGMLGFQNKISADVGYDGWIVSIISGISINIIIFLLYKMLKNDNNLINIHTNIFGKLIGTLFTLVFSTYLIFSALIVFRTYINVLQIWIFPTFSAWYLGLFFIIAIYYAITGGFRVVLGVCFWGTVIPFLLIFFIGFPMKYAELKNILPMFNHSLTSIMKATKDLTINYLGFESILIYYPFIKNPEKSHKWAQISSLTTMVLYTVILIISCMYFNEEQMKHALWATLNMTKIISFPILERFEYVVIFMWLFVVMPTVCIPLWSVGRILEVTFNVKPKFSLLIISIIIYSTVFIIKGRVSLNMLNHFVGTIGLYVIYVYIPFLFVVNFIRSKIQHNLSS
ncbi:GerAB/ArcD/ProY family transporter [Gottfriedia luciferensis]|uniref:GerAB/ArcD/ProY family transporter n=1 Tax=Gottfriedia luciferensis TaxID=178774 RepID=UPI000B43B783|nr:GerAB/ArcD/ProY family transporter [Gottfriedia luciferensis]